MKSTLIQAVLLPVCDIFQACDPDQIIPEMCRLAWRRGWPGASDEVCEVLKTTTEPSSTSVYFRAIGVKERIQLSLLSTGRIEMRVSKRHLHVYVAAFVAAAGLAIPSAPVFAAASATSPADLHPGMMSGAPAGRPADSDYGPGYGRERGMMGGRGGYGPEMMGQWGGGYGRGMMGGPWGGWREGHGLSPGMMRGWGLAAAGLALSDEQQDKIDKIHADVADTQWNLAGKIFAAGGKLRELLAGETPDRNAVETAYRALSDLRLKQIELRLDTRTKVDEVLTKEQREHLRTWRDEAGGAWR